MSSPGYLNDLGIFSVLRIVFFMTYTNLIIYNILFFYQVISHAFIKIDFPLISKSRRSDTSIHIIWYPRDQCLLVKHRIMSEVLCYKVISPGLTSFQHGPNIDC